MNIHCVVIGYGLPDDMQKLFEAADAPNITWHIFLHSTNSDVIRVANTFSASIGDRGNVYSYYTNRGLSRSWNEGIDYAYKVFDADVAIILNDDMLPGPGDVQRVAKAAIDHPEMPIIKCMGMDLRSGQRTPMEFGLTAITKRGWETIGAFDENIWPIYWEDIDWDRRRRLSGQDEFIVQDTVAIHAGSKTSVTVPGLLEQTNRWYDANLAYYRKKWGAAHTEGERFSIPFDERDGWALDYYKQVGAWYINPAFRSRPYGIHDREDVPRG